MNLLVAVVILLTFKPVKAGKCPRMCSCDTTKLTVTCASKNLTAVPPTVDEITVKLDLRNNNMKTLPKGSFVQTPYLTHLNLQSCKMEKVMEGAFRALGRLVSLNLAYNNIDILYQESFDGLSALKELNLHHNRIEEIQPGAFTQLGILNLLALTHNQLVYIPNMAFQGLHNIKWLRLSYNSLNNLAPEAFAGLFTLTRLSLDHNELQFFPTQTMTRLSEVTRLDMNHNPMIYLGEEAVSMAKLTHLYLDHMSLQDVSDQALSNAPSVSHLDVSYNQLRYLEPLSGPKQLVSLNLTGNPVYCNCFLRPLRQWAQKNAVKLSGSCTGPGHLSDELLQKMTVFDLRCRRGETLKEENEKDDTQPTKTPQEKVDCPENCGCDVEGQHATCEGRGHTKVPKGFPNTTQLLDLRNNHFHYLPINSFKAAGNVISLHLDLCKIHEIQGGAFSGMRKLLYLYMSDNELTSLDPEAFKGAPQLTYLHLEGNRLLQFPGTALAQVPHLFVLHLERNAISKVEPSGLLSSAAPNLRELYLTNNTITAVAKDALDSKLLAILHIDMNQLEEVPTQGLSRASRLEELNLSHNSIKWVGPNAFQPVSRTLRKLQMNKMGTEKMSSEALSGLGPELRALSLRGNSLEVLPDLRPLSGLELVDLHDIPLLCDCAQLPLYRWLGSVSLEISATCGSPPEHKGLKIRDVLLFKSCPKISKSLPASKSKTLSSKPSKTKKDKTRSQKEPTKTSKKTKKSSTTKSKVKQSNNLVKTAKKTL
ncbi:chondroadherin-like protein [Eucyclogobius newberryi]|uniref:chondroadherin-like protein n=1 Tax=Eucyclogobius newberryi TaxID=166745 RepID=UPI003B597D83